MKSLIRFALLILMTAFTPYAFAAPCSSITTPTFSPAAGTYAAAQSVTVTVSSPAGTTICYRTDGVSPSASGPGVCAAGSLTYSSPVTISTTSTIQTLGTKTACPDSAVASAAYTITTSGTRKRVRVEQRERKTA
jgi:hypothetical protein